MNMTPGDSTICAVVLAAGLSSRMGTQKMLLPLGGKTVVGHVVGRLLSSKVKGIYVVVGHQGDQVAAALGGRGVTIAHNPDYAGGMLTSLRCGLKSLPHGCEAALVVLGDQPAIRGEVVDRLIETFISMDAAPSAGKRILIPCHQGRRGHPVLIPARFFPEILTRHDAVGLRGLMQSHPDEIVELEMNDPALLTDMDSPADYERERINAEFAMRNAE